MIICKNCGAKRLEFWFKSRVGKHNLCGKCYLEDIPVKDKKK